MKKLKDEVSLGGKTETITMMDFRSNHGEMLTAISSGKTFVITKRGEPVAMLSPLPEERKPTIRELEDILAGRSTPVKIEVAPNGEIKTVPVTQNEWDALCAENENLLKRVV